MGIAQIVSGLKDIRFRSSTRIREVGGFKKAVSKRCGFSERIHWFRVDGRPIRIKIYTVSKISGFVWSGPNTHPILKLVSRKKIVLCSSSLQIIFFKNTAAFSNLAQVTCYSLDVNYLMFCCWKIHQVLWRFSSFSFAVLLQHDRTRSIHDACNIYD